MPRQGLDKLTLEFAQRLTSLLNHTVTDGIRLSAVTAGDRRTSWVGYEISKDKVSPDTAIPLGLGTPQCYLYLAFTLRFDDEGDYIMVEKSTMAVCLERDISGDLFHYDYERDKPKGYPDAHLQVSTEHSGWDELCSRLSMKRTFPRIHLPLGPRRFRPALEDVVEFLIIEKIVEPRSGWEAALSGSREEFAKRQLRAAIRRDLDTARAAVEEFSK